MGNERLPLEFLSSRSLYDFSVYECVREREREVNFIIRIGSMNIWLTRTRPSLCNEERFCNSNSPSFHWIFSEQIQ